MPRAGDTFDWGAIGTWNGPATADTLSISGWNALRDDLKATLGNSLARDGTGTMGGPLKLASGTVGAPGLPFATDLTSGFYRVAANEWGLSLSGALAHWFKSGALLTDNTKAVVTTAMVTQDKLGQIVYPRTQAEINATVTPSFYTYEPGDIRRYGALSDGATDCAPALRSATASSDLVIIPLGTWLLNSEVGGAQHYCVTPRSGVTTMGFGDGSVLKIANGFLNSFATAVQGIWYENAATISDCKWLNFKVDFNGVNNLVAPAALKTSNAVYLKFCTNVVVDNCWFSEHPGRQILHLGENNAGTLAAKEVRISNCVFKNVSAGVAGNVNNSDHSTVFVSADRAVVCNNIFVNGALATTAFPITAMECHCQNSVWSGNTVTNYTAGVITAAITTFTDCSNNVISENVFNGFFNSSVWLPYCGAAMKSENNFFINNIINTSTSAVPCLNLASANLDATGTFDNCVIRGNVIRCTATVDPNADQRPGIQLGKVNRVVIDGNIIDGFYGRGIELQSPFIDDSLDLTITNNQIYDCGKSTNVTDLHGAITLNTTTSQKNLWVHGNVIENRTPGKVTLAGAFAAADSITVVTGGVSVNYIVTAADVDGPGVARSLAAAMNNTGGFSALYVATNSGAGIRISTKSGNVSTTLTASFVGGTTPTVAATPFITSMAHSISGNARWSQGSIRDNQLVNVPEQPFWSSVDLGPLSIEIGGRRIIGDVAVTLLPILDPVSVVWNTALTTATRICTLSHLGVSDGQRFNISRPAAGGFALEVRDRSSTGTLLKSMATLTWCNVEFSALLNAWTVIASGSL